MTQFLPPNLLALFAPRDPIPYLPPLEKLPHEKHHNQPYCGIAPYIREFEVSTLGRVWLLDGIGLPLAFRFKTLLVVWFALVAFTLSDHVLCFCVHFNFFN